jgi:hypothetical protein
LEVGVRHGGWRWGIEEEEMNERLGLG